MQEVEYYCPEPTEESEDPLCQDMGPEYSSDEAGDGPHSSEEYDPLYDAIRKRKQQQKEANQKYRSKRRKDDEHRSKEYDNRRKKRRIDCRDRQQDIE